MLPQSETCVTECLHQNPFSNSLSKTTCSGLIKRQMWIKYWPKGDNAGFHWTHVLGSAILYGPLKSNHYSDVIMSTMASQIIGVWIWTVYSGADQRNHQSSAWLAFVREIHRWPVDSPHKGPVTRKVFPFDDVIISWTFPTTNHRCVVKIHGFAAQL